MIHDRLKEIRKSHRETLDQWVELTGISRSALSRIENGKQQLTYDYIQVIFAKITRSQKEKDYLIYGTNPVRDQNVTLEQQLLKAQEEINWLKKIIELDKSRPIIINNQITPTLQDSHDTQALKGGQNCDRTHCKPVKSGNT